MPALFIHTRVHTCFPPQQSIYDIICILGTTVQASVAYYKEKIEWKKINKEIFTELPG